MDRGDNTSAGRGPGPDAEDEPQIQDAPTAGALYDDTEGRWQITTQTSIYVIDLDRRTVIRIPGAAGEQGIDPQIGAAYPVAVLEDDRRPQPLWLLVQCRVDEPMYLYTNRDATSIVLRGTTPVRQIRRLAGPEQRR